MNSFICFGNKPGVTREIKQLDRKCKRDFSLNQKSHKWQELRKKFKEKCKKAKERFYKNMVEDLKESNPSQWLQRLKEWEIYQMTGLGDIRPTRHKT